MGRPAGRSIRLRGETTISFETDKTQVLPTTREMPVSDDLPPPQDGGIEDEGHRRAVVEAARQPAPRLARGVELIGRYEGSGFKNPPFIARRRDGQMVQMAELLYLVAEEIDGTRGYDEVAQRVTERFGRGLDAEMTQMLVEEKLVPLGVAAPPDGREPELKKIDPLLALKFRAAVVPERLVNAITHVFRWLYFPPVVAAVLAGLVALDVWLFGYHGIAQSIRSTLYDPLFILLLLGLIVLSAAFHECGHATACRYGGARPGVMGVGLYIVWPAFYTDVTDAYRLGKKGRLRTDLGGVYFNTIFILLTAGAYFATGFEPLLLVIPLQHLEILHQFLPFIRLDGYYIVSDLTGVPDMFARIKPVLKGLLPWRETDKSVLELKRWARVAVTAYVLLLVPLLAVLLGLTVMNLPRVFGTAWSSGVATVHKLGHASALSIPVDVLQLVVLILIPVGLVLTFAQLGRRLALGSWRSTQGRPAARAGLVLVAAAVAAFGAYTWYPRGSTYAAISRADRGTFGGAVNELGRLPSGHPPAAPAPVRQSPARSPKRPGSTRTGTSTTSTATTTGSAQTTPTATTPGSTTAPAAATTPAATTTSVATTTAATTPTTTTATTSSTTPSTTATTTTTTP